MTEWGGGGKRKGSEMMKAHKGRNAERGPLKKCYRSSKEGEITEGQDRKENHLRIVAFWKLYEDLYFV